MLSEDEHVNLMLYRDSQEIMEGPKILHGEFPLDGIVGKTVVVGGGEP
jgi:hypothetical protein